MDSLSYSMGILVAQNLKQQGFNDLNGAAFAKGLEDVMQGNALQISPEQANQIAQQYLTEVKSKAHAGTIEAGKKFLAENANREEVTALPSGLQYEVMNEGSGVKPTANDKVSVHYHGTLLDGTVFDSSVKRGQPAEFGVTQVIPGWVEALQLMPTGSKWKLFIPYNLAYGDKGAGPTIKPFSTLVFEVELLGIK
ncbi:MAG: FKBP-type peptidyl-prolyl cis-trans isomerase [Saprospiraceae bacterium]|nr:FKBP-type peptidyl-prolyl cis-trans isomerase [Saprospiraceae bacterium]